MTKKHKQKYCGFLHFLCLGNKGLVLLFLLGTQRLEAALKERWVGRKGNRTEGADLSLKQTPDLPLSCPNRPFVCQATVANDLLRCR